MFVAFAIAPVFGGLFMILMRDNGLEGLSGVYKSKAMMLSFAVNWDSYFGLLTQSVGVGGVIVFGFVASWLFGREYSDRTAKDLLSLPISRTKILNAKFFYCTLWCFALVISNLLLGLIIGFLLQSPGWEADTFLYNLKVYFVTTVLIVLLNTPIAFFAIFGRGYMTPLGIVVFTMVLAQILGAMGFGKYFPWSVPGIYSGAGGEDLKNQLNSLSYIILSSTSVVGYLGTILWWKHSDQAK